MFLESILLAIFELLNGNKASLQVIYNHLAFCSSIIILLLVIGPVFNKIELIFLRPFYHWQFSPNKATTDFYYATETDNTLFNNIMLISVLIGIHYSVQGRTSGYHLCRNAHRTLVCHQEFLPRKQFFIMNVCFKTTILIFFVNWFINIFFYINFRISTIDRRIIWSNAIFSPFFE